MGQELRLMWYKFCSFNKEYTLFHIMINKLFYLILILSFALPLIVLAQFTQPIPGASLTGLFNVVLSVFWVVATVFAVVCFVLSGIMFMTAMGDPSKLKTARSSVMFGVVGIIVAILAYSIIGIIESVL